MSFRRAEEEFAVIQQDSALQSVADARSLSKGFWGALLWRLLKEIILEIIQRHDERVRNGVNSSENIDITWKQ